MRKWDVLENILVEKLVFWWKGFARLKSDNPDIDWKAIFITGGAIPDSIVNLRVLKKKKDFIETQILEIVKKSPIEKQHPTNQYGMSWGWKWINIPYEEQLKIKENQVKESLFHIEKLQEHIPFEVIEPSPIIDWYRNKVEFSFWKFISAKYDMEQHFNVWFHKQWEFSKIEDFDGCPLIDEFQNIVFKEVKDFAKQSWLPVYDSMRQTGFFRHLMIRKTHFTNQMMLILGFNDAFSDNLDNEISQIETFFKELGEKYPEIKSIYLSYNSNKADIAIWDLELIYWKEYITEELHWLHFNISPKSFFQTNSSGAEKLYSMVTDYITPPPTGTSLEKGRFKSLSEQVVLDLYGGTGTIGMIFSKAGAKEVYSVEMVKSASEDGKKNAQLNKLENINFVCAKVEDFLWNYLDEWKKADLLVIDPPRVWMHPNALPNILKFDVKQIIYVSCNPATLARDLDFIMKNSTYKIEKVWAMDMFPDTSHIETVVSLIKK